ncbi:MAG: hypothetical protein JXP48_07120 [Acidobacteria bacterium]|nr:hypothetical protein [Acidobacteriota bacterium]
MRVGIFVLLLALSPAPGNGEEPRVVPVRHDHLLGGCRGELVFGAEEVRYASGKKDHERTWKYGDIQQMTLFPDRVSILTYRSRPMRMGGDEAFNFRLLSGTLDDGFRREMEARMARPLVSGIVPRESSPRFALPARHRKFPAGTEGVLEFGEEQVVYRTSAPGGSALWRYDELESLGSTGPFQLRLGAPSPGGPFGSGRNYVFDLKRRLEPEEYDFIWERIHRRHIR